MFSEFQFWGRALSLTPGWALEVLGQRRHSEGYEIGDHTGLGSALSQGTVDRIHFTDEDTEAQRGLFTCLRSHSL